MEGFYKSVGKSLVELQGFFQISYSREYTAPA